MSQHRCFQLLASTHRLSKTLATPLWKTSKLHTTPLSAFPKNPRDTENSFQDRSQPQESDPHSLPTQYGASPSNTLQTGLNIGGPNTYKPMADDRDYANPAGVRTNKEDLTPKFMLSKKPTYDYDNGDKSPIGKPLGGSRMTSYQHLNNYDNTMQSDSTAGETSYPSYNHNLKEVPMFGKRKEGNLALDRPISRHRMSVVPEEMVVSEWKAESSSQDQLPKSKWQRTRNPPTEDRASAKVEKKAYRQTQVREGLGEAKNGYGEEAAAEVDGEEMNTDSKGVPATPNHFGYFGPLLENRREDKTEQGINRMYNYANENPDDPYYYFENDIRQSQRGRKYAADARKTHVESTEAKDEIDQIENEEVELEAESSESSRRRTPWEVIRNLPSFFTSIPKEIVSSDVPVTKNKSPTSSDDQVDENGTDLLDHMETISDSKESKTRSKKSQKKNKKDKKVEEDLEDIQQTKQGRPDTDDSIFAQTIHNSTNIEGTVLFTEKANEFSPPYPFYPTAQREANETLEITEVTVGPQPTRTTKRKKATASSSSNQQFDDLPVESKGALTKTPSAVLEKQDTRDQTQTSIGEQPKLLKLKTKHAKVNGTSHKKDELKKVHLSADDKLETKKYATGSSTSASRLRRDRLPKAIDSEACILEEGNSWNVACKSFPPDEDISNNPCKTLPRLKVNKCVTEDRRDSSSDSGSSSDSSSSDSSSDSPDSDSDEPKPKSDQKACSQKPLEPKNPGAPVPPDSGNLKSSETTSYGGKLSNLLNENKLSCAFSNQKIPELDALTKVNDCGSCKKLPREIRQVSESGEVCTRVIVQDDAPSVDADCAKLPRLNEIIAKKKRLARMEAERAEKTAGQSENQSGKCPTPAELARASLRCRDGTPCSLANGKKAGTDNIALQWTTIPRKSFPIGGLTKSLRKPCPRWPANCQDQK